MIDIQSISITIAALSIIIAAIYYAMNLQEIRRSRRITLTTTVLEPFMTVEGNQLFIDLMTMTWDNPEDFMKKYDHRVDTTNFAKRSSMWNRCNAMGSLFREGLLDLKTLYGGTSTRIVWLWFKFKPIIENYRGSDFETTAYRDWEYMAERLLEYTDSLGSRAEYLNSLIEKPGTTT